MSEQGIVGEVSDDFTPEPEEGPPQPAPIYQNRLVGSTPTQDEAAGIVNEQAKP